ncbi:hypothetical protein C0J52_25462, partial [Blattella germanica]
QFSTPRLAYYQVTVAQGTSLFWVSGSIIVALLVVSVKMSTRGMRLRSFTCSEKLKIIEDAEEYGNHTYAYKFDESVFLFKNAINAGYLRKYGICYTGQKNIYL